MAEHVSGLREVLAAHVWEAVSHPRPLIIGCDCGWEIVGASPEVDRVAAYQDHLAAVILAWVAERLGSAEIREAVRDSIESTANSTSRSATKEHPMNDTTNPERDHKEQIDASIAMAIYTINTKSVPKVERDGKVAILVSPGYGAGWSTWMDLNQAAAAMFAPDVVAWVENGEVLDQDTLKMFVDKYGYTTGANIAELTIEWIPVGTRFNINERDGYESLQIFSPDRGYYA